MGAHIAGSGGPEIVGEVPRVDGGDDLVDGAGSLGQGSEHLLLPFVAVAGVPGNAGGAVPDYLTMAWAEDVGFQASQGIQRLHILPQVADAGGRVAEDGIAAEHGTVRRQVVGDVVVLVSGGVPGLQGHAAAGVHCFLL